MIYSNYIVIRETNHPYKVLDIIPGDCYAWTVMPANEFNAMIKKLYGDVRYKRLNVHRQECGLT